MAISLKRSPVIFGCSGVALTPDEDRFFRDVQPHAFILFARNIGTADEVRTLCAALRATVAGDDALIFIDQEGGRVARLKPPLAAARGPMARFEGWGDLDAAADAVFAHHRLMAAELMALGINADCSPVCDIRVPGAHDIIGDRAFSEDANVVARLARAAADGLLAGGVMPVIKHIPGHGRAGADTHEQGAVIGTDLATLAATDFVPFKALRDIPYAMTAHVTLTAVDPDRCVTLSKHAIDTVIRGTIGYQGLLMSDDLSMKALDAPVQGAASVPDMIRDPEQKSYMTQRGRDALAAGCDLLLHCNGDMAEMVAVAAAL